MKKIITTITIIVCVLLLSVLAMKLFFMPWYGHIQPDSVKDAKKSKIFIEEYTMDIVEIFDTTYQSENFESIFLSGTLYYERNILGIVYTAHNFTNKRLVFIPDNKNSKLREKNYLKTWIMQDCINDFAGTTSGIIIWRFKYDKNYIESFDYTIYLMTNSNSIAKETLIPVLKFKLVPKENEN
jgi:hypothetical protein